MPLATAVIDLRTLPLWGLWLLAAAGIAAMLGAVLWILPPALRRRFLPTAAAVVALFVAMVLGSSNLRAALWFGGLIGLAMLSTMVIGQMPADMPPANDPAIHNHPLYPAVRRRGWIATAVLFAVIAIIISLSMIFVDGLFAGG